MKAKHVCEFDTRVIIVWCGTEKLEDVLIVQAVPLFSPFCTSHSYIAQTLWRTKLGLEGPSTWPGSVFGGMAEVKMTIKRFHGPSSCTSKLRGCLAT